MHIYRNTTTVIYHGNRIIFIDNNIDMIGISGKRFVNRVIYYLIHQMMQPFYPNISNIHSRAFPYGFKTFQHLNTIRRIRSAINI